MRGMRDGWLTRPCLLRVLGAFAVSLALTAPSHSGTSKSDMKLKLLYPLDEFYVKSKVPLPPVEAIAESDVPEPYKQLLVHKNDMTPTLEQFHSGRIHIRVLDKRNDGDEYAREVVLLLNGSEQPVEFGAIVIHLQHFSQAARAQILDGKQPLGTILAINKMEHRSKPLAFIRVTSDAVIKTALKLEGQHELYGRRNVLFDARGNTLADVLEILPPVVR